MKKILFLLAAAALMLTACRKDEEILVKVSVQLTQFGEPFTETVPVMFASAAASYTQETDETGKALFEVPFGAYTASVSFKKGNTNFNGTTQVVVELQTADPETGEIPALPVTIALTASNTSALIIKEYYDGGCKDNTGTKNYFYDKFITIYNNSDQEVDASRMCITMAQNSNTQAANKYTITDGIIEYELAGWTPASFGIWWFQTEVKMAPYSQIVVAITGGIDHTKTYSNSVDLSKADFVFYDKESGYNLAAAYPAPAETIDPSHYMKTYQFGQGTVWAPLMANSAPYLLIPEEGVDIKEWVKTESNFDNRGTNKSTNFAKVPIAWVLDALEEWPEADATKYFHRFPTAVNTGYNLATKNLGYTQYRNVDKEATEAIAENAGKLVYNYAGAVSEEDTDPSGIDAEASIGNGAKIVYMDTNNSANDFHQRKVASIKK